MVEPLYVNTEGVLGLARVHDAIAAGLGRLQSGAGIGAAAGPGTTHGLIAYGMHSALGGVMERRDNILQSTSGAAQQMSEQLHRAAEAYRAGDQQSARGMSAAAERMPESGGGAGGAGGVSSGMPGGLGAAVPGSPAAGAGGVDGGVGAGHAAGTGLGGPSDPDGADHVGGNDNSSDDDRDHDRDREHRDPDRHERGEDESRILSVGHRVNGSERSERSESGKAARG